jgi:4-amino-4-deoxy-L-arabinose transferase-like glycosyltransferase
LLTPLGLCVAAIVIAIAHAPLWIPLRVVQAGDEGYIAAFAWRMAEGNMLPYVDAVSHRGPLVYFPPAILALLFGGASALPVRMAALLFALGNTTLVYVAGERAGHRAAAVVAAIAFAAACTLIVPAWIPYHGEHVVNACTLGSFALLAHALRKHEPSPLLFAFSGALAIGGFLTKLVAIVVVPIFGMWILSATIARKWSKRPILAWSLGVIAPPIVVVLRYAAAGELRTLRYYFYEYNASVYMAPYTAAMVARELLHWLGANLLLLIILFGVIGASTFIAFRGVTKNEFFARWDREGFTITCALCALGSLCAAKAPLREFIHYDLPVLPWALLLAAVLFVRAMRHFEEPLVRAAIVLMLLLFAYAHAQRPAFFVDPKSADLCATVRSHASERDTMFVWGFEPWLYPDCERKPASRYVFTTFLMGYVPWFDEPPEMEASRVTPASHDILLAELRAARPAVIVDAPIGWRSLDRYPDLARVLDGYCLLRADGERKVYALRLRDGSCPEP